VIRRKELIIEVQYEVKVIDPKTGKVLKKVRGKGGTFNQNFGRLLGLMLFPRGDVTTSISVTDTVGTARTMIAPTLGYPPNRYEPDVARRLELVIGRSDVAFSRTQYNVLDYIATMDYSTYSLVDDGTKVTVEFSGSWYNDTGVAETVREIGFICRFSDSGGGVRIIMLARDVITPVDVPAGATIAVAYAITIPF